MTKMVQPSLTPKTICHTFDIAYLQLRISIHTVFSDNVVGGLCITYTEGVKDGKMTIMCFLNFWSVCHKGAVLTQNMCVCVCVMFLVVCMCVCLTMCVHVYLCKCELCVCVRYVCLCK